MVTVCPIELPIVNVPAGIKTKCAFMEGEIYLVFSPSIPDTEVGPVMHRAMAMVKIEMQIKEKEMVIYALFFIPASQQYDLLSRAV